MKDSITTLKVSGTVNDRPAVSGRMVVDTYNLQEREGVDAAIDRYMNHKFRLNFRRLCNQLDFQQLSSMVADPLASTTI